MTVCRWEVRQDFSNGAFSGGVNMERNAFSLFVLRSLFSFVTQTRTLEIWVLRLSKLFVYASGSSKDPDCDNDHYCHS